PLRAPARVAGALRSADLPDLALARPGDGVEAAQVRHSRLDRACDRDSPHDEHRFGRGGQLWPRRAAGPGVRRATRAARGSRGEGAPGLLGQHLRRGGLPGAAPPGPRQGRTVRAHPDGIPARHRPCRDDPPGAGAPGLALPRMARRSGRYRLSVAEAMTRLAIVIDTRSPPPCLGELLEALERERGLRPALLVMPAADANVLPSEARLAGAV